MHNWCNNYATLTGPKERIDELIIELRKSDERDTFYEVLNKLRPNPSGEWDYDWSVENWGTKWDVSVAGYDVVDETSVGISFDSAWSPPIALYDFLQEEGWTVDAYYYEPGVGFCGHYFDGVDDCYDISGMKAQEVKEMIPEDLDEMFLITEDMLQWEEDSDEEKMG